MDEARKVIRQMLTEDLDDQVVQVRRQIRVQPEDTKLWSRLALLYDRGGNTDQANEALARVIVLDNTENPHLINPIAERLTRLDPVEVYKLIRDAYEEFAQTQAVRRGGQSLTDNIGFLYYSGGGHSPIKEVVPIVQKRTGPGRYEGSGAIGEYFDEFMSGGGMDTVSNEGWGDGAELFRMDEPETVYLIDYGEDNVEQIKGAIMYWDGNGFVSVDTFADAAGATEHWEANVLPEYPPEPEEEPEEEEEYA